MDSLAKEEVHLGGRQLPVKLMGGWVKRGWVVMGRVFELKGPAPVISKTGRSNAILGAVVLRGACLAVTETFSLANSIAVATDLEARRLLWVPSIVASVASDNSETMLPRVGLKMSLQVVNRRGGLTINSSVWRVRYIVRWLRHGNRLYRQIHRN